MIPHPFSYHAPTEIEEALDLYDRLAGRGGQPCYLGGGTEILTYARRGDIRPSAVIDLKGIGDTRAFSRRDGVLRLGAALTLDEATHSGWPLLADAAGRVADHTTRRQITLGGNLAGDIFYREAALPFVITPTTALVAASGGVGRRPFEEVFPEGRLGLEAGAFLVALEVPLEATRWPGAAVKRTRLDWVDYPLVTVALADGPDGPRVALSGFTDRPFRAPLLERSLREETGGLRDRIEGGIRDLPKALDDVHGSAAFRRFALAEALIDAFENLEEGTHWPPD